MSKHHCPGWSEARVNRWAAAHAAKSPACETADVCVHHGVVFISAFCTRCGRKIR